MNIIGKYIVLSVKKNFAYRYNAPLVILDEGMDCLSLWLFWSSLLALDLGIGSWGQQSLELFMGFSLISSAVSNLFVGSYDIQSYVLDGRLDHYLVKPCSPTLLILLERANFLRFLVTFPTGVIFVLIYAPWGKPETVILGIGLCILASVLLELIHISIYELSFWLKKVDTIQALASAMLSVQSYPLVFFGKKVTALFTFIIPVAFVGTIPTELIVGGTTPWNMGAFAALALAIVTLVWVLWQGGRRRYESAN